MSDATVLILVIEADVQVRRSLRHLLSAHAYKVIEANTYEAGIKLAAMRRPNLVILGLMASDLDGRVGLDVVGRLRQLRPWNEMPIMILSAREDVAIKVAMLDTGADDYINRPHGTDELLARVRVSLRHMAQFSPEEVSAEAFVFTTGDLRLDFDRHQVFVGQQEIHLTPIEYRLLVLMAEHVGEVMTYEQLLNGVWGEAYADHVQYLRVYMRQLRRKLKNSASRSKNDKPTMSAVRARYVQTERRIGYRLVVQSS